MITHFYTHRQRDDVPGTITTRGNNQYERLVVNIHAQFAPGRPRQTSRDTSERREHYFMRCLRQLEQHMLQHYYNRNVRPQYIGCGLAGGHWPTYRHIIRDFARRIKRTHHQEDVVTICCLKAEATSSEASNDVIPTSGTGTTTETRSTVSRGARPRTENQCPTYNKSTGSSTHNMSHNVGSVRPWNQATQKTSLCITMMMWIMTATPSGKRPRLINQTILKQTVNAWGGLRVQDKCKRATWQCILQGS